MSIQHNNNYRCNNNGEPSRFTTSMFLRKAERKNAQHSRQYLTVNTRYIADARRRKTGSRSSDRDDECEI